MGARRLTRGGTGRPVLTRMDLSMNYVCAAKTPEEDSSASVGRGSLTTVLPSPSLGGSARIARSLSCCSLIQSAASGHSLSSSRVHLLRTETVIPFSLFFSKFSPSSWSPIWSRILHDYRRIRDALSCDAQPSPRAHGERPNGGPGRIAAGQVHVRTDRFSRPASWRSPGLDSAALPRGSAPSGSRRFRYARDRFRYAT